MNKLSGSLFLLGLLIYSAAVPSSLHADVVTVPTDLSPGDPYRLVFVTSGTRDTTSLGIADYNAFVTDQANQNADLARLGASWFAIASTVTPDYTSTVDARDNTSTTPGTDVAGIPIYLVNSGSNRLADSYADLWDGSLDNFLSIDQDGNDLGLAFV